MVSRETLRRCSLLLLAAALGGLMSACSGSGPAEEPSGLVDASYWPRTAEIEGATVEIFAPQVISWNDLSSLDARVAVMVTPSAGAPFAVTLVINADTVADLEERAVDLVAPRIVDASMPGLSEDAAASWRLRLEELLPTAPMAVSLDFLLTSLAAMDEHDGDGTPTREVGRLPEVPPILYSSEPAILVMVDGEPLLAPIDGSGLRFVVNTNWDLLTDDTAWFLRVDDGWLSSDDIGHGWRPAGALPPGFGQLRADQGWAEAVANLPGRSLRPEEVPAVFVSYRPAELIVTDGPPALEAISGTRLQWVTNTDSDLFELAGSWFLLVSGRWFTGGDLAGPWNEVSALPAELAAIPQDHECADVRASIPGTVEAAEAVRLAQVPTKATVSREATAEVRYDGEPRFEPIESTSMEYAVNTASDVIRIGDLYYLCFQGVWFTARSPQGPWQVSAGLPDLITTIPPSSPVYHTTYVQVYDTTPTTVVFGYSAGYMGIYVSNGTVVFGTGWYHPPYVYYPPHMHHPIYHPYPVTFGVHAYYNPHTGTYARGGAVYGPYGGAGRSAAYNPSTGTYARGASAWGPYGGTAAMHAYNPRTGAHGWSHQSYNQYEHWGESLVQRGDDWIHTGHYGNSRGTVGGFETSNGSKGIVWRGDDGHTGGVVKGPGDSYYAGRDGNVYRRTEEGWSKHENVHRDSPGASTQPIDARPRGDRADQSSRQHAAVQGGSAPDVRRQPPPAAAQGADGESGGARNARQQQPALQGGFGTADVPRQPSHQTSREGTTRGGAIAPEIAGRSAFPRSRAVPVEEQVQRQLDRDAWARNEGARRTTQSRAVRSQDAHGRTARRGRR